MDKKRIGRGLTKPIIYTDRANYLDPKTRVLLEDELKENHMYVLGVDPANGKDQAIYNGKVVK